MLGIAAGLASAGKKPYVYSGTLFIVARAYEQLRDDICYNNANVRLIGTKHSGFLGFSHNLQGLENTEDLLKNLPKLIRYYPEDEEELERAMESRGNYPLFIQL
jgi:transketolase